MAIKNAELKMSAQIQQAESTRAYGKSIADVSVANANVYSSAAMSGMNSFAATILTQS